MPWNADVLAAEVARWFWPFVRVAAMVMVAPVFGAAGVPVRVRLVTALALTAAVAPVLPAPPAVAPASVAGLLVGVQQLLIGLATGFALRLVFAAIATAGQVLANTMGLGFASSVDPQNGVQVPVLSQFLVVLATLVFVSVNGHLILIDIVAGSFRTLPVAAEGLGRADLWAVAAWGGELFAGAVLIALPVLTALLLLNLAFGVITRAAPQLNIFAVGFPLSMLLGFVVIWVSLPGLLPQLERLLAAGLGLARTLLGGG
ncbi:flagellar biosynthetic protein FliR [Inmirania thermothiophila]|uniref:Flagellar biosynthetic protein FliR n=1 Tax=Inmirania thermothiophila TaxID=1750597 RepID=A0A3N1Y8S8_9GAMM|nr:flagellar biosynthetic protein FliR [Inmirania thermothiophila]